MTDWDEVLERKFCQPSDVEEASPHYPTCTHRMDNCVLVKDAEACAVFWDPRNNRFHYSIRVADWYGCSLVNRTQFEEFQDNPHLELQYIQQKVRELKSLQ